LAPGTSTPQTYRVRAGDNLWTIAERHNTTTDQLKKLNNLRTTRLKVGQELKIR
jgi:membrane-bound lytic murein transglycosylase D